ncbi:MAG: LuxR family transcriptional regulator, partial [Synergistaceae bacterium]|nr:LuxR family transcriptional regulator [Synergistaceae bacterium]
TEIALLLATELDRSEILLRCGITNNTLKSHIRRIYRKLDVKKRSEIVSRLSV